MAGSGTQTTNTYYGPTTTIGSGVCSLPSATPQYSMLQTSTGPAPASGTTQSTTYAYNYPDDPINGDDLSGNMEESDSGGPHPDAIVFKTSVWGQ